MIGGILASYHAWQRSKLNAHAQMLASALFSRVVSNEFDGVHRRVLGTQ